MKEELPPNKKRLIASYSKVHEILQLSQLSRNIRMQLVLSDEGQFFLKKQIVIELDLPVEKEQIL